MNRRRRLAILLVGVVGACGVTALPAAQAEEPVPSVTTTASRWGCAWLDALDFHFCLGR